MYCRREEELGRYHKELEREVPLSMTPEFRYSDAFVKKGGGGNGNRVLSGSSGLDGSQAFELGSSRGLGSSRSGGGSGGALSSSSSSGDASIQ